MPNSETERNEERIQDLLIDYGFSNDIDFSEPEPVKEKKEKRLKSLRYEGLSALERKELEKTRRKAEATFRSWLVKNKPTSAVLMPIETNTASGVLDLYGCYAGHNFWFECKTLMATRPAYIRGTQYIFMKKLLEAGGNAKVIVQRLDTFKQVPVSIHIYNAKNIVCHPIEFFNTSRDYNYERLHFPKTIQPDYKWFYASQTKEGIEYLMQRMFLDSDDFIW